MVISMKKLSAFISLFTAFSLMLTMTATATTEAISFTPTETVYSEAAYMVNLDTDIMVYEKNSEQRMYPASLTKIMTAIIVLENVEDIQNTYATAPVSVFNELYGLNASTADFRNGEEASISDLLYGMMLQSACEAAGILAYYVGGESVPSFINMMNEKAAELGCTNTNFTNPHGLFDENQYTTAKDMAIITQYALSLPNFAEISCTPKYELAATNKHTETRLIKHTNTMLDPVNGGQYYYEYVKGIKTGTLDESGRCLVSIASKDGYNYLLVTLKAPLKDEDGNNKYYHQLDHKNIYMWAFENLSYKKLLSVNEEIDEVAVTFSDANDWVLVKPAIDYSTMWSSGIDLTSIQRIVTLEESVQAPVYKGDTLGTIELKFSGETLAKIDLLAAEDVPLSTWKYNLDVAKRFISHPLFKAAIIVIILLIIGYIVVFILVNKKKRRKMKKLNKKRKF